MVLVSFEYHIMLYSNLMFNEKYCNIYALYYIDMSSQFYLFSHQLYNMPQ